MYTNPPDDNNPTYDLGIEEDDIWNFRQDHFNQMLVWNQYMRYGSRATRQSHIPYWGSKLVSNAWYKDEKVVKLMDQWKVKIGLENIKLRQALETCSAPLADPRLAK